jgi:hypothetical protein
MRFMNSHAIALIGAYVAYLAWYFATVSCRHMPESQARPQSFRVLELLVHLSITPHG